MRIKVLRDAECTSCAKGTMIKQEEFLVVFSSSSAGYMTKYGLIPMNEVLAIYSDDASDNFASGCIDCG